MPVPTLHHRLPAILKPSDELVLRWLHRYHYLNSRQLCRLGYSQGSLTYVQSKLKSLTDAGYCLRLWLPKREPHGSAPSVYTLARRGLTYLRSVGVETHGRHHPSEKRHLSYLFLEHTLELNDVLISAELLCRAMPGYRLARFRHEQALKRMPVRVSARKGSAVSVIPDAWLDLRLHDKYQICLVIELDRGTEEQKRWRQKVNRLVAYANGPYQETFRTRSLTITVITSAGEKRLTDLLSWTEAELESLGEVSQGDLFLFTALVPESTPADDVFLSQRWFQPFQRVPLALLESPD